jgi:predicted transcriptional regulator of viral defense system
MDSERNRSLRPATRVLGEVSRRRRRTIRLPADLDWLGEISPSPRRLLSQMAKRGDLYRVGEDRYVVAPPGTESLSQAAPPELLIDLALKPHPYYIGFLSALIAHRLTDLHSRVAFAAVPGDVRPRGRLPLDLRIAQVSEKRWPAGEGEIERFRALDGTKEFAHRSTIERTLVDCLLRPDLCGGFETVALAWSRARQRADTSWDRVAQIGRQVGDAATRRTAFMLGLVGLEAVRERHLGDIHGRSGNTPLDRANGFGLSRSETERDRRTGVLINMPAHYLRGWIEGESSLHCLRRGLLDDQRCIAPTGRDAADARL